MLVHTGQHYDDAMSRIFFEELGVGAPDHMLGVGSGSHAQQTARVMERLEPVLLETAPDIVLVPGDVNSTLAASLIACKLGITVGHIEAGLRSFDRTMPEEINRMVADAVSDLLFTTRRRPPRTSSARASLPKGPQRRQYDDRHAAAPCEPASSARRRRRSSVWPAASTWW